MPSSKSALTPGTLLLLVLPPLLWAGNAVVGRMVSGLVPPITLNLLRWVGAFVLLIPFTGWVLKPGSPLWANWRRYTLLGLLGVGCYNAFQYLALKTSTPINVTLVAASTPVFMLVMGQLFFGQRATGRQYTGAALSILGVLVVLCRGDWHALLQLHLVVGDVYILIATAAWAWYSWLLASPGDPPELRNNWAAFLMAQMVFGLGWSGLFSAAEWRFTDAHIQWGWPLIAALVYVVVGPAIVAYRSWGMAIQRVGPATASIFGNLTPPCAAVFSAALLGELPKSYHALAFVLIVGGIIYATRPRAAKGTT